MERKIGEIFEINGEWYQCVEHKGCYSCAFALRRGFGFECVFKGAPRCTCRSDGKLVIFKKLEKVGEPITVNGKNVQLLKTTIANCDNCAFYKDVNCDFTCYPRKCYGGEEGTYVEIKQTKEDMGDNDDIRPYDELFSPGTVSNTKYLAKEDMEENKLNLKPFDLQKAREDKPVYTRNGRKARIVCFDRRLFYKNVSYPILALVERSDGEDDVCGYNEKGKVLIEDGAEYKDDLMMLPEKKEGWINIYNADTTFYYVDGRVFETKDEAVKEAKEEVEKEQREKNEYIDTIRVEWEE